MTFSVWKISDRILSLKRLLFKFGIKEEQSLPSCIPHFSGSFACKIACVVNVEMQAVDQNLSPQQVMFCISGHWPICQYYCIS